MKCVVFDPRIGQLISLARSRLNEAISDELACFDITAAQYFVFSRLALHSLECSTQLCRESSYDTGAMTRMIDRLEKKGLVQRVRSPTDRRVMRLELTDQGKNIVPALQDSVQRVAARLLKDFSRSDLKKLEQLLEKLLAAS